MKSKFLRALGGAMLVLLAGCTAPPTARTPRTFVATVLAPVTIPPTATVPEPTPAPAARGIWVDPLLPAELYDDVYRQLTTVVQGTTGADALTMTNDGLSAVVRVQAVTSAEAALVTRTYALAAAFPTVPDDVAFDEFTRFWAGDAAALAPLGAGAPPTMYLDADARAALSLLLGPPADSPHIVLLQTQDVLSATWEGRPNAFAVVPFDRLDVRYKLLHVDGVNLFEREADMSRYPLSLRVGLVGEPAAVAQLRPALIASDNRRLDRMAVVAMTGVTALVRGTAVRMEEKGITYPAEKIRDWLATADLAHISNEVSFYGKCPFPTRNDGVVMCSNPKYIELLRYVGTDVVELTGNHTWDYGAKNLIPTIEMYEAEGWKTFGGGRNLEESQRPAIYEVNGNRIAFIGCSSFGTNWAREDLPGATPCGTDDPQEFDWILGEVRRLRAEGYLVIATLQYTEFYEYVATRQQDRDFRAVRDAGAVVVNGSQGHHVQGFDVSEAGFCHYGTGNIFFGDQVFSEGAQTTMVDRHVFYDGRYLGVDLRTAKIEDISQPVPMTPDARAELLQKLFEVSGY